MLNFETAEKGNILVVTFLEVGDAQDKRHSTDQQTLYQIVETHGDPRFAFDLSAVHYLSSADIAFLVSLRRKIAARNGRVILFGVDRYLYDLMRNMKLHEMFEFAGHISGALFQLSNVAPR